MEEHDWIAKINSPNFWSERANVSKLLGYIQKVSELNEWQYVIGWHDRIAHQLLQLRYLSELLQLEFLAIEAADATCNKILRARLLHDMGDIYSQQGLYLKAESAYEAGFKDFESIQENRLATQSLHMLSLAKRALGKRKEARRISMSCIERAKKFDMGPWMAHPYHLLGWLSRDEAKYDEALAYLKNAFEIHQSHNSHDRLIMMAQSNYDIAKILILANRYDEARKFVDEAEKFGRDSGANRLWQMTYKLRGDIAFGKHDYDDAIRFYHQALDYDESAPDERRVAETKLDLARANFAILRFRKAIGYLQLGIYQLKEIGLWKPARIWSWIRNRFRTF